MGLPEGEVQVPLNGRGSKFPFCPLLWSWLFPLSPRSFCSLLSFLPWWRKSAHYPSRQKSPRQQRIPWKLATGERLFIPVPNSWSIERGNRGLIRLASLYGDSFIFSKNFGKSWLQYSMPKLHKLCGMGNTNFQEDQSWHFTHRPVLCCGSTPWGQPQISLRLTVFCHSAKRVPYS